MSRITSNYDGKEGDDEEYIYGDIPHQRIPERYTQETYWKLVERAKDLRWNEEPVRYYIGDD